VRHGYYMRSIVTTFKRCPSGSLCSNSLIPNEYYIQGFFVKYHFPVCQIVDDLF